MRLECRLAELSAINGELHAQNMRLVEQLTSPTRLEIKATCLIQYVITMPYLLPKNCPDGILDMMQNINLVLFPVAVFDWH